MRIKNLERDDPFKNKDLVSVITDPDGGCTLWIARFRDQKRLDERDYNPFHLFPQGIIRRITIEDEDGDGEYSYWHTPLGFRKFVNLLKEEGWRIR